MRSSLSVYDAQTFLDSKLSLPISKWGDKPAPMFIIQVIRGTHRNMVLVVTFVGKQLGIDIQHVSEILQDWWMSNFPLSRIASVAITAALPGLLLTYIRNHPDCWAARHQIKIVNALHVIVLATVANRGISIQDLLVAAFVMISYEALQQAQENEPGKLTAIETLLSRTHSIVTQADITSSHQRGPDNTHEQSDPANLVSGTKDEEIDRLHALLTELKTAEKAKEVDLRRARADLQNARATLSETFTEYSSLRDELKTMKSTLGRDHQAIIYRKDIELFALRKANEQKENAIKERDTKLEATRRQQKAALESKDAEIRNLKDRLVFWERRDSPRFSNESSMNQATEGDSQAALQVKFLRVKGRNSAEIDERTLDEKDNEIAKLKSELAEAMVTGETLARTQVELRRAWNATAEAQKALNDERTSHVQTQDKLQELVSKTEDDTKKDIPKMSLSVLPTIEEQDKQELEAMFNAAQQDNLRLYGEVAALDKRVREANARVFMSEQEASALSEQLRLEKAINDDMETARPSLVHRVHFQRMEGQLKETHDMLDVKDGQIAELEKGKAEQERKIDELSREKQASEEANSKLQEDNQRLERVLAELESTKEQLMLDHERLARHRTRQRTSSSDRASARSSGATLITEPVNGVFISDEPLPARPVSIGPNSSIQVTPERHVRRNTTHLNMISNDVPPPELRHARHKSLTLKGLMRKIVGKDNDAQKTDKMGEGAESTRPKIALMPKNKNGLMRPKTAAPDANKETKGQQQKEQQQQQQRPKTSAALPKEASGAITRPQTVTGNVGQARITGINTESQRPKSRGWAAS